MQEKEFVTVRVANGMIEAAVLKSKLESYGIPVLMEYESVCIVFGLSMNGLGRVEIKVPRELQSDALVLLDEKDKG